MKSLPLAVFTITSSIALSVAFAATTASVHPIVDAQSSYLIGGSKNGKWINEKATAKMLKA